MISKFSFATLLGTAAILAATTVAFAALSGDEAIKARKADMKANGKAMGVMVPMIKGEKPYDQAAVAAVLDELEKSGALWKEFFPEDSKTSTTLKTRAAEAIWTDPKGFEAASAAYYTAFTALKATKDEASFKAAFPALGKSCGGCHEKFRSPE
jgi:cytochrome c556